MSRRTPLQRFLAFVRIDADGCHRWTGCLTDKNYGKFKVGSRSTNDVRTVLSHKWYYEEVVGSVPEGFELDHLCRNHDCVNIGHLQPVTRSINQKRGSNGRTFPMCPAELHLMEDHNVIVRRDGKRNCRACKNIANTKMRRKGRPSRAKNAPPGALAVPNKSRRMT